MHMPKEENQPRKAESKPGDTLGARLREYPVENSSTRETQRTKESRTDGGPNDGHRRIDEVADNSRGKDRMTDHHNPEDTDQQEPKGKRKRLAERSDEQILTQDRRALTEQYAHEEADGRRRNVQETRERLNDITKEQRYWQPGNGQHEPHMTCSKCRHTKTIWWFQEKGCQKEQEKALFMQREGGKLG